MTSIPKKKGTKGKAPTQASSNLNRGDTMDEETTQLNLTVPKSFKKELKQFSVDTETPMVDIVIQSVRGFIEKHT